MKIIHKNKKEDIKLLIDLGADYHGEDIVLTFSAGQYGLNKFVCSYVGGVQTNCVVNNSTVLCLLDNHGLSLGMLSVEIEIRVPDTQMPDGDFRHVTRKIAQFVLGGEECNLELTNGESDYFPIESVPEATISLLSTVIKGEPGKDADIEGCNSAIASAKKLEETVAKAEAERKKAENERQSSETERKQSEEVRLQSESERNEAEQARKLAEEERNEAEASRNTAETQRVEAEIQRQKDVEDAIASMESAEKKATEATKAAQNATENANNATSSANEATTNAVAATQNAQSATEATVIATEKANAATTNANAAAEKATTAANNATEKAAKAETEANKATAAATAANEASNSALSATSDANYAASLANEAANRANSASEGIEVYDDRLSAVENAQKAGTVTVRSGKIKCNVMVDSKKVNIPAYSSIVVRPSTGFYNSDNSFTDGSFVGCDFRADTTGWTSMVDMFRNFCGLQIDVSNLNTSQVTSMQAMFQNNKYLTSLDLGLFDTSQVTNMRDMFYGCSSLTSLNVSSFDTSQVTNMSSMFYGLLKLSGTLDLRHFDMSKVTNLYSFFYKCAAKLNMEGCDTSNVTNIGLFCESNGTWNNLVGLDFSSVTSDNNGTYRCLPNVNCSTIVGDYTLADVRNNNLYTYRNFGYSMDWSRFGKLNVQSFLAIINGLKDLTGQDSLTLTLPTRIKSSLTDDDIAKATDKNWTIIWK